VIRDFCEEVVCESFYLNGDGHYHLPFLVVDNINKMKTKTQQIKDLFSIGDDRGAVMIAARFPRLGDYKADILRAREAFLRPANYEAMGYNIEELKQKGIISLRLLLGL
jgi:hypothetical protein